MLYDQEYPWSMQKVTEVLRKGLQSATGDAPTAPDACRRRRRLRG
jgi:hypothetical protein